MRRRHLLPALPALLALPGCSRGTPLRLGFLGGLSGKFADLGIEVRNAALLCIEAFNRRQPLPGGPVELIDRDDGQDPAKAAQALTELAERGVAAVVGPVTSSIGTAVVRQAGELGLLLLSPTITTARLSGQDDAFVRVCGDTRRYGLAAARVHARQWQAKRFAMVWDIANADYSVSWTESYAGAARDEGMRLVTQLAIDSRSAPDHAALAGQLMAGEPDLVVLCCSSVDAAALMQRLRQRSPKVRLAASAWASTSRTLELAGRAADGALFEQLYDPLGTQPAYQAFTSAYVARFGQQPTFPGLLGHEATQTLLSLLARGVPPAGLKAALVGHAHDGLQGRFEIDVHGDVQRDSHHLLIRDGRYERTGWTG